MEKRNKKQQKTPKSFPKLLKTPDLSVFKTVSRVKLAVAPPGRAPAHGKGRAESSSSAESPYGWCSSAGRKGHKSKVHFWVIF